MIMKHYRKNPRTFSIAGTGFILSFYIGVFPIWGFFTNPNDEKPNSDKAVMPAAISSFYQ